MIGPDHKCSMNLEEFNKFIESIRLAEKSLGDYNKFLTKSEKKYKDCKKIYSCFKSY